MPITTTRVRLAAAGCALLVLGATACGEADLDAVATSDTVDVDGMIPIDGAIPAGVEATPRFLQGVADETEAAASLRFSFDIAVRMSVGGVAVDLDPDEPYASGEIAGGRMRTVLDVGALMRAMVDDVAEELGGGEAAGLLDGLGVGDLTLEIVQDESAAYLRAPVLGALAGIDPAMAGQLGPLTGLGDRWGYVDLTQLDGVLPADVLDGLSGGESGDPMRMAALLRAVEGEVTAVGRTEVRGQPVTHLTGTVTLGRLLAAQGQAPEQLGQVLGSDAVAPAVAQALGTLVDTPVPIDVYVGDDGLLRRLAYRVDLGAVMAQALAAAGEVGVPAELVYDVAMDVYDVGAPDIVVELPDRADAVDLTDWLRSLVPAG